MMYYLACSDNYMRMKFEFGKFVVIQDLADGDKLFENDNRQNEIWTEWKKGLLYVSSGISECVKEIKSAGCGAGSKCYLCTERVPGDRVVTGIGLLTHNELTLSISHFKHWEWWEVSD